MAGEIETVRRQLAALDAERRRLEARLRELERPSGAAESSPIATPQDRVIRVPKSTVTNRSAAEKNALFHRLSGGRSEVFPVRWDNRVVAKSQAATRFFAHKVPAGDWVPLAP